MLDREIDDIARKHFNGRTGPRDYTPGLFSGSRKRLQAKATAAALETWKQLRNGIVDRMVAAAAGPEALEVRRRRKEEQRRAHAARERQARIATVPAQPSRPDRERGPWD